MINFFKMGAADFWGEGEMLSISNFYDIWYPVYYAGQTAAIYPEDDYFEYVEGFEFAWGEHDLQIERGEKPRRFEGFGAESRSYEPLDL